MPAGRPTDYNEDIAAKFCAEIALGNSLRSVVARDDMPSHTAIYEWLSKHKEFAEQYARAKEDSGDSDADRIEEIAEKVLSGEIDPQQGRVAMKEEKKEVKVEIKEEETYSNCIGS